MKTIVVNENQMEKLMSPKRPTLKKKPTLKRREIINKDVVLPSWDEIKDLDGDDEEGFYDELNRLSSEGVLAFQNIKKLYQEHPYALNNSDKLKSNLDKIEIILQKIENIYEF